ncbi:hypothetical protein [Synechococcus phage S-H25]|nr:hypothetical protein [Synechococcus phage S-H25]
MPSEIAQQIVSQVFADDKAAAIDSINDALGAAAFDVVQQRKIEFAKEWGFDLGDTGQEVADELADTVSDSEETPTAELPQEETTDEDDETDS